MDRKTRKAARKLTKSVLRQIEGGKDDVARELRMVRRKAVLAGAGGALTAMGVVTMLASSIFRTASRARRRSALFISGATSALGLLGMFSAKKLLKRLDLSPAEATHRIKHAVSTAAKAMS